MAEELDDIGKETAAVMRTMLQIATLVALRTRERGQKEAEARVKVTEARMKEARELQVREARESKAKDPRNVELTRLMERAPEPSKGLSLEKDRVAAERESVGMASAQSAMASAPTIRYDSAERRNAIAQHLERLGVAPELAAVRMLVELGNGAPPEEAVRTRAGASAVQRGAREQDPRGLERTRN
ncbi:hypothetical protein AB0H71_23165 [Nocardia sp. NPDC050697]|uniref:hypothetical protein n=1 Tax=Nocardia sp. NPDC050697 TaxID=3155158 RepID=UPI0033C8E95F